MPIFVNITQITNTHTSSEHDSGNCTAESPYNNPITHDPRISPTSATLSYEPEPAQTSPYSPQHTYHPIMTMFNTYHNCTPSHKPTYIPTTNPPTPLQTNPHTTPQTNPYTSPQSFRRQQKWKRTSFSMARCPSFLQDDVNGPPYQKNLFPSPIFSNSLPKTRKLLPPNMPKISWNKLTAFIPWKGLSFS
ncbi:hypothetical protein DPMN_104944 [Dreissena polymorpha]|uniref:Uncharacterized protein n=1 Tax=Dreissena polymorpha TaxID=45954 RepID=A0A9D4HE10_DREPO|nr:hypothetical protein DPMN_104944 [Dreissena polymorpha]